MKKIGIPIFLIILTVVSLMYRLYGLNKAVPFWVDEFSTAEQARLLLTYGLSVFTHHEYYFEFHNITPHILSAISFSLLGKSTFAARLPIALTGSFIPLCVFILTQYLFNRRTAVAASLLSAFAYIEIVWSLQARGYVIQQILTLLTLFVYYKLFDKKKLEKKYIVFIIILGVLGIMTHVFYFLLLTALCIHWTIFYAKNFKHILRNPFIYVIPLIILAYLFFNGTLSDLLRAIRSGMLQFHNSFWYYHSFLWREYGVLTVLTVLGLILALSRDLKKTSLILLFICIHLFFIGGIFGHYISKYTLPIFPFLFIFPAYVFTSIANWATDPLHGKYRKILCYSLPILLALFIIANGYKFVTKPKKYYSVNHDFREIANIDYNEVYNLIHTKGKLTEGKTAVIDTWPDRIKWYLPENDKNNYIFRWIHDTDPHKITTYTVNTEGEKKVIGSKTYRLIGDLSDLQKALRKYPKGFIFIDDTTLPKDVIEYAQKHFKKELYLDHYPLDDNPYSIWPATLYSWGI
jgi:4-amino-4-deoxy-L-arabinose transferase-like glycosyltransferase